MAKLTHDADGNRLTLCAVGLANRGYANIPTGELNEAIEYWNVRPVKANFFHNLALLNLREELEKRSKTNDCTLSPL